MRDMFLFQLTQCIEHSLHKIFQILNCKPVTLFPILAHKMFQIHFCAFHDNKGILMFEILVDFHFCDKIAKILDHELALFRKGFHEGYLL